MPRSLIFLIAAIVTLMGFGCQSPSSQHLEGPSSAKINIGGEPQTLDPRRARDLRCQTLSRMLFEGLVRMDPHEKPQLALAKSVEVSSDLKTYTFHLKPSLWSNGDLVRASDFVYAWKKILSPDFPSDCAFLLYVIKNAKAGKEGKIPLSEVGISSPDEGTLVVELETPIPYFLNMVAIPVFFPVNQKVDQRNPHWSQSAAEYVCNGPFQLKDWKHQDHLLLTKNGTYWDAPAVKLSSIELQMVQEDTEFKLFEKGELDWAGSPLGRLPVDALAQLKREHSLLSKEVLGTYFIRINTLKGPLTQPGMRRALALAINRQGIVDHITQGGEIPATGLVPASFHLQKKPYFQDGDVQQARELFAEADKGSEMTLLYPSSERSHLIAQAIQQQWLAALGIRIQLEGVEGKVYLDRISRQDYQMAISSWIADFVDPINFLEVFKYKEGRSNNTHWENSHFIALLESASQTADPLKRMDILAQSEQILIDEMPMIPIFYYSMLYVREPALKGVVLSSMGQIDFKWASMEKENQIVAAEDEK